jgi:hypothetical protein
MSTSPKYPNIKVKLTGTDGNAFSLMGRCTAAIKESDLAREEVRRITDEFRDEAMSGDYDHLVATCANYFKVS